MWNYANEAAIRYRRMQSLASRFPSIYSVGGEGREGRWPWKLMGNGRQGSMAAPPVAVAGGSGPRDGATSGKNGWLEELVPCFRNRAPGGAGVAPRR